MAPFQRTTLPAHLAQPAQGRPSDYRPEYCQAVISVMAQGLSLAAFAGFIGKSRMTVYRWINAHADFSDAVTKGNAARQLFLERKLLNSRRGAETVASIFALKNAAPDDWRDVRAVDHTHTLTADKLTDAQLDAIIRERMAKQGRVIDGEFWETERSETG